jgi:hypothetical protein
MKKIYLASDPVSAEVLVQLLGQEGIEAVVQGEDVYTVFGGTPFTYPSVWIANESDQERAEQIVGDFELRETRRSGAWRCPVCGEEHEQQFDVCWSCGAERPQRGDLEGLRQQDTNET